MSHNADLRTVSLERTEKAGYVIRNTRGGEIVVGTADGVRFTPVELFLGALAACGAIDLDLITSKRAQPERMRARVEAHKVRDELGNRLVDLTAASVADHVARLLRPLQRDRPQIGVVAHAATLRVERAVRSGTGDPGCRRRGGSRRGSHDPPGAIRGG